MRVLVGDFTRGRRELLAVLRRTEVRFVAARCRVTRAAVYNWTGGHRRPHAEARRALALNYGIAPTAWDERTA